MFIVVAADSRTVYRQFGGGGGKSPHPQPQSSTAGAPHGSQPEPGVLLPLQADVPMEPLFSSILSGKSPGNVITPVVVS